MKNPLGALSLFISLILFSIITPFLLMPNTRHLIAFCCGRAYGSRYQNIFDTFRGRYGSAMA
jgi:hypothetical protein